MSKTIKIVPMLVTCLMWSAFAWGSTRTYELWELEPAPNNGRSQWEATKSSRRPKSYDRDWERWSYPIGNGYGSRYWKVCEQQNEHLAFTTRGKKLYAIKLARPTEPFTIEGTAGWEAGKIQSVKLLGCDADIPWQMTPSGLRITPLADLGQSSHAWSFEIVTDEEQHAPNVMVEDADAALKNTRKVDLEGRTGNN